MRLVEACLTQLQGLFALDAATAKAAMLQFQSCVRTTLLLCDGYECQEKVCLTPRLLPNCYWGLLSAGEISLGTSPSASTGVLSKLLPVVVPTACFVHQNTAVVAMQVCWSMLVQADACMVLFSFATQLVVLLCMSSPHCLCCCLTQSAAAMCIQQ